jgi:hypothetical protein
MVPMSQGFQSFPANAGKALENGPGLMAGRRHYTKVVLPLQPSIISGRLPPGLEGEMIHRRFPPGPRQYFPHRL